MMVTSVTCPKALMWLSAMVFYIVRSRDYPTSAGRYLELIHLATFRLGETSRAVLQVYMYSKALERAMCVHSIVAVHIQAVVGTAA